MTHPFLKAFVVAAALGAGPAAAQDIHVEILTPENPHTNMGVHYWNLCLIDDEQGNSYFPEFCEISDKLDEDKKQRDALCAHDFAVAEAAIDLKAVQEGLEYGDKQALWSVAYDEKEACESAVRTDINQQRTDAFARHIGSGLTITLSR